MKLLGQSSVDTMSTELLSDLNVKVHEFNLVHELVDLSRLQPAVCLLLPAAQVDENAQTGLGVAESRPVRPVDSQRLGLVL